MTNLIKVNPTEFGLSEEIAQNITKDLAQILSERQILSAQFSEVIMLDIDDPATAKRAAELRKLVKANRTKGIENWHKVNKEFYLRGGQFVDAIKRKEVAENERMEEVLEQIEKRQEILEKERLAKLQTLRVSLLTEYVENAEQMALSTMQDDVWDAFYNAKKKEFEERKEAERLAEIARIEKEKAEEAERERIRLENERLKAEAEAREKEIAAERKKQEESLAQQRRIAEEAERKAKAEADKLKREAEEKLKAEQEAKAKIEAELKAKKEAEERAEKERLAAEEKARKDAEKLAKAPIKKQLHIWVASFTLPEIALENQTKTEIAAKFESFKDWATKQVENI